MEKINKRRSTKRPSYEGHNQNQNNQNGDQKKMSSLIESTLASFEKKQLDPSKFGRQELKAYMLKYHKL